MTDTLDDLLELWAKTVFPHMGWNLTPMKYEAWPEFHGSCQKAVRAIHDATTGAGLVVVPRVATDQMHYAAMREWDGRMSARSAGVWQAMITAHEQGTTDEEVSGG